MKMLKSFFTLCFCLTALTCSFAFVGSSAAVASESNLTEVEAVVKAAPADFAKMTPAQVEKIAGRKLTFKEKVALKVLKAKVKKAARKGATLQPAEKFAAPEIEKGVYILIAFFIPFVAVGLASDWEGSDWIIALVLSLLCWLPGFIYALVKMKEYYG
jgi:uncharacterized membrane protein YqaE (UPF0057 family)